MGLMAGDVSISSTSSTYYFWFADIRKLACHWYDQIVLIAPNLVDAIFYF